MNDVDPVTYSVIINSFEEIASEMEEIIVNTARNIPVVLARDFSIGVADSKGDLISSAQGVPIHLGGIDLTVKAVINEVNDFNPGDIILTNDPYDMCNTHLPDFTMVMPIFASKSSNPLLYLILRADQADVGAKDPIRSPVDTKELYNEGLIIPPVKIVEEYSNQNRIFEFITKNSRTPEIQRGDLQSMISALRSGEQRAKNLIEKYGEDRIQLSTEHLLSTTAKEVTDKIRNMEDGVYYGESQTDTNPDTNEPVHIRVKATIDDDRIEFDFSESDKQLDAPINNTLGVTHAAVKSLWYAILDTEMSFNSGCVSMIEIKAPKGTIVNPEFPHAIGYSTVDCAQETSEACLYAFQEINPSESPAGPSRWVRPFFSGQNPDTDDQYRGMITSVMGGGSAMKGRDGVNGIGKTSSLGTLVADDPEEFEAMYPFHIQEMDFQTDSGGSGKWRGGLGPKVVLSPDKHTAMISVGGDFGQKRPPKGHLGGLEGNPAHIYIEAGDEEYELEGSWRNIDLSHNELYIQESSGGGGVGKPYKRDPEKVRRDVENGYVSLEAAKDEYRVAIDPESLQVDEEATNKIREEIDNE